MRPAPTPKASTSGAAQLAVRRRHGEDISLADGRGADGVGEGMSHLPFIAGDAGGERVVGRRTALLHTDAHAELGTGRHHLGYHHQVRALAGKQGYILVVGRDNAQPCRRERARGRGQRPFTVGEDALVGHAADGHRLDGHAVGHLAENHIHGRQQMIELQTHGRATHTVAPGGL